MPAQLLIRMDMQILAQQVEMRQRWFYESQVCSVYCTDTVCTEETFQSIVSIAQDVTIWRNNGPLSAARTAQCWRCSAVIRGGDQFCSATSCLAPQSVQAVGDKIRALTSREDWDGLARFRMKFAKYEHMDVASSAHKGKKRGKGSQKDPYSRGAIVRMHEKALHVFPDGHAGRFDSDSKYRAACELKGIVRDPEVASLESDKLDEIVWISLQEAVDQKKIRLTEVQSSSQAASSTGQPVAPAARERPTLHPTSKASLPLAPKARAALTPPRARLQANLPQWTGKGASYVERGTHLTASDTSRRQQGFQGRDQTTWDEAGPAGEGQRSVWDRYSNSWVLVKDSEWYHRNEHHPTWRDNQWRDPNEDWRGESRDHDRYRR